MSLSFLYKFLICLPQTIWFICQHVLKKYHSHFSCLFGTIGVCITILILHLCIIMVRMGWIDLMIVKIKHLNWCLNDALLTFLWQSFFQ